MADYSGHDLSALSFMQMIGGEGPGGMIKSSNAWLSDDQAKTGVYSICVGPGGFKRMFYAAEAGAITIDCHVYPEAGSAPLFYAMDLGGEIQDTDTPLAVGAWEALQLAFVALKKIYIIVVANPIPIIGTGLGDGEKGWCYFDSIE
jgi:hypothetical protein